MATVEQSQIKCFMELLLWRCIVRFLSFAYVSLINVSVHICSSTFPDVYSTPGRNLELCMRADLFRYIAYCSSFAEGRLLGRMTTYGLCGTQPN